MYMVTNTNHHSIKNGQFLFPISFGDNDPLEGG